MSIPRIRGKSGQIEHDPKCTDANCGWHDKDGQWVYEISIWDLSGENQVGSPFIIGPFATQEIAQVEGLRAIQIAAEAIEKAATGGVSGKFLDLKNGAVMRPWKNHS